MAKIKNYVRPKEPTGLPRARVSKPPRKPRKQNNPRKLRPRKMPTEEQKYMASGGEGTSQMYIEHSIACASEDNSKVCFENPIVTSSEVEAQRSVAASIGCSSQLTAERSEYISPTTQSPATARINGIELSKLSQEKFMVDGRYLFVYDLFKAVKELTSPQFVEENLPAAELYVSLVFGAHHKDTVQTYVKDQTENFASLIKKSVGEDAGIQAYEACLKKFQEMKPVDYTESEFMKYCGAIAYLGIYFAEKSNFKAFENAFMYVFTLLGDVLEKAKKECDLSESSW